MNIKPLSAIALLAFSAANASAQRYLDHYEPKLVCQHSTLMTERDAWQQWAGSSYGPQGMDCTVTYVPVYVNAQSRQQVIANIQESQAILAAQSHGYDPMLTVEYHFDRYGYNKVVRMPLWYAVRLDADPAYRKWYIKEFKVTSVPKAPPLPDGAAHGRIEFWELW